jgi:hypothetical protein
MIAALPTPAAIAAVVIVAVAIVAVAIPVAVIPVASKVRIDIEEIEALQKRRREINALDLKDIEFFRNGEKVEVSYSAIREWDFVGLSNIDFVEMGMDCPEA